MNADLYDALVELIRAVAADVDDTHDLAVHIARLDLQPGTRVDLLRVVAECFDFASYDDGGWTGLDAFASTVTTVLGTTHNDIVVRLRDLAAETRRDGVSPVGGSGALPSERVA